MLHEIINKACQRSFGTIFPQFDRNLAEGSIAILPFDPEYAKNTVNYSVTFPKKSKIILFGEPPVSVMTAAGLKYDFSLEPILNADACLPCQGNVHHTESDAWIFWQNHFLNKNLHKSIQKRPFARFDFTDEWNNLGFGRIFARNDIWSVKTRITTDGATQLASIYAGNDLKKNYAGAYMALYDAPDFSILWCARPVGPVDSVEWSVIENFVANWRPDELPCWPVIRQTPKGCQALVTMRLDCDEDISSAWDVFEWYHDEHLPFSLALKTSLRMSPDDLQMIRDVNRSGGSILSHSHRHAQNWGENYDKAFEDALTTRKWLREKLPDLPLPENAVSPFHTNPGYAIQAIEEAGFTGLVSGIIHNDPEYLLGRAGSVPLAKGKLVSISEQCMLHGDCYLAQGNINAYLDAFLCQYLANGIFGYLDHPFSKRYQYGWLSKEQRLKAHQELISAIRNYENVWFWNQNQCLEFVKLISGISFRIQNDKVVAKSSSTIGEVLPVYIWKGEEHEIKE